MKGPCLCGDPYCPSCGDPERAKHEDYIETFVEDVLSKLSFETLEIIKEIAPVIEKFSTALINKGIEIEREANDHNRYMGE